jgi:NADH dehydrogenase
MVPFFLLAAITGFLAYIMWASIHVLYLVGWGNRIGTAYTWARAIWFGHNRAHRIITFETAHQEITEGHIASGRPAPVLPLSATSTARVAHRTADRSAETGPG